MENQECGSLEGEMIVSEHEKRWRSHLQTRADTDVVVRNAKLGEPDGDSFVLTLQEMRHLLDLLSQARGVVSNERRMLISEHVQGPLDDLLASFAYQRAL